MSSTPQSPLATTSCQPLPTEHSSKDIVGSLDLHQLFYLLSFATTIICAVLSLLLALFHFVWRSNLAEQRVYGQKQSFEGTLPIGLSTD